MTDDDTPHPDRTSIVLGDLLTVAVDDAGIVLHPLARRRIADRLGELVALAGWKLVRDEEDPDARHTQVRG